MAIRLFIEYYTSSSEERQKELNLALELNLRNKFVDHVYIVVEKESLIEEVRKITSGIREEDEFSILCLELNRPPYGTMFRLMNEFSGSDDILILANNDIVFDRSILLCIPMLPEECYALTRYEPRDIHNITRMEASILPGLHHGFSQDTWIFRGKIKENLLDISFSQGTPACDSIISGLIQEAGYKTSNPCLSIFTYHIHKSDYRTYDGSKRLPGIENSLPFTFLI